MLAFTSLQMSILRENTLFFFHGIFHLSLAKSLFYVDHLLMCSPLSDHAKPSVVIRLFINVFMNKSSEENKVGWIYDTTVVKSDPVLWFVPSQHLQAHLNLGASASLAVFFLLLGLGGFCCGRLHVQLFIGELFIVLSFLGGVWTHANYYEEILKSSHSMSATSGDSCFFEF